MYRMLQAVEKQPIESTLSYDEKTNVQSPTPTTNYQQQRDTNVWQIEYNFVFVTNVF